MSQAGWKKWHETWFERMQTFEYLFLMMLKKYDTFDETEINKVTVF